MKSVLKTSQSVHNVPGAHIQYVLATHIVGNTGNPYRLYPENLKNNNSQVISLCVCVCMCMSVVRVCVCAVVFSLV